MLVVRPNPFETAIAGLGTLPATSPTMTPVNRTASTGSPVVPILIGTSIFLLIGAAIALQFYQASKGIAPVVYGGGWHHSHGHDHHGGHGPTFSFSIPNRRRGRGRRRRTSSRRRYGRSHARRSHSWWQRRRGPKESCRSYVKRKGIRCDAPVGTPPRCKCRKLKRRYYPGLKAPYVMLAGRPFNPLESKMSRFRRHLAEDVQRERRRSRR